MAKMSPLLLAGAGAAALYFMSKKKGDKSSESGKVQDCSKLYDEKGFMGYNVSEANMKKITEAAKPLIMAGNTDVDTLAVEILGMIDPDCDWGVGNDRQRQR